MQTSNNIKEAIFNDIELIKGAHYLVKHEHNKQQVRRIFRGIEYRFDNIPYYVFTGKVSKNVSVDIEPTNNPDINFWRRSTKTDR